jgi:flavin reductase (DIM6/NTAB) family NADH-FMN oxidoreductase RutF
MTALALAPPVHDFGGAMRAAVTGVNVVTTAGVGGRLGLTVTSLAPVSAEIVSVAIVRDSPLMEAVRVNGSFGVSVLGAGQLAVAETFAGRGLARYDFGVGRWHAGATGAPLLAGAAARFDCVLASMVEAGSHTLVIGDVLAAEAGDVPPLAHTGGDYAWISATPASSVITPVRRAAEIGRAGRRSSP